MKLAPLQLTSYFLTELAFSANQSFDPSKEYDFHPEQFDVPDPVIRRGADDFQQWEVVLSVRLQPQADANAPYHLALTVVGRFWVVPDALAAEMADRIVATNAPTMLFGIVRELVRQITSMGPFAPILIPSVSFFPDSLEASPEKDQPEP